MARNKATRKKDNPMDDSDNPVPRPPESTNSEQRKKDEKKANMDGESVKGKTDKDAFDARNNNLANPLKGS